MRITDITVEETSAGATLAATAVWRSRPPDRVYFTYRGAPVDWVGAPGDALSAAFVVPCMALGEDLVVDAPVSEKLQAGIRVIVDIFLSWRMGTHRTRLEAESVVRSFPAATEIGSCFSGGADSYFTILRERDEPVSALLTLVGYDLRHENRPIFEGFLPRLAGAAAVLELPMVVVDTNAYEVGRRHLGNGNHHGAILAAAALGMSARLRRFLIPSSWAYRFMKPHGSHPFVDPLWSSESLEVVHDSPELCKIERVTAIADVPVVLDTLRTCSRYPERYNCGRCNKCVLVALILTNAGTIDRCRTLPRPTPAQIRRMLISPLWLERFELMRDEMKDEEYRSALGFAIRASRLLRAAQPVSKALRRFGLRH